MNQQDAFWTATVETITHLLTRLFATARRLFAVKRLKENSQEVKSLEGGVEAQPEQKAEPGIHGLLEIKAYEGDYKLKYGPLTDRETTLLKLYLAGCACDVIAAILNEDKRVIRADLNKLRAKVRGRLSKDN